MEPINIYKTYEKYKLPKYATNIGMYKLMREKYFSKDIHSPIKQGKCLSQKEFIKEKEKLAKAENINIENINSNRSKKSERSKQNEEIKEITKSSSHNTGLIYKDPNDYTKRELKNNTFYFDKNNNQMLQQKKWIFENKK